MYCCKTIYKERVVDKKRCIDDWSWNGVRVSSKVCVCPIFLQGEQRRLYTTWVKIFNIFNILCMYIDGFIMYMYFIYIKNTSKNRECVTSMWTCTLVRTTCNTHSSTNSKYFINACIIWYHTVRYRNHTRIIHIIHHARRLRPRGRGAASQIQCTVLGRAALACFIGRAECLLGLARCPVDAVQDVLQGHRRAPELG